MGVKAICRFVFSALLLISVAVCSGCKFLCFSHTHAGNKVTDGQHSENMED